MEWDEMEWNGMKWNGMKWNDWKKGTGREQNDLTKGPRSRTEQNDFKNVGTLPRPSQTGN